MKTITDDDIKNLYNTIKNVLNEMIENGGRDTEKDLVGNLGGYITYMSNDTYREPCMRCGYEIHKEGFMGRCVFL